MFRSEISEQQGDSEMYSRSPDYGDFHGFDLWVETSLSQIDRGIYANFRKPSWETLKHRLSMGEIHKKLFIELGNIA